MKNNATLISRKYAGLTLKNRLRLKQYAFAQPNQKENVIYQKMKGSVQIVMRSQMW